MEEKFNHLNEKLETQITRINNHSERIDDLEKSDARITTKMEHLIEKIDSLISTIKWAGGIAATTLVGFFIWYIQQMR